MADLDRPPADRLAGLVARILEGGTATAAVLMLVGLLLVAVSGPTVDVGAPTHVGGGSLVDGLAELRGVQVIVLGAAILLVTPMARVAVSLAFFAREGDRAFVAITAYVLVVLLVSVLFGLGP